MTAATSLDAYLAAWSRDDAQRAAVAAALGGMAAACIDIAAVVARGPLGGALGTVVGTGDDGDRKALDVWSDDRVVEAMQAAGVRAIASEERESVVDLGGASPILVAFDPLDGSSNIDTNVTIGTIFSVLPAAGEDGLDFFQPGREQLAAGYVLYGPNVSLALTIGDGVQMFTLDPGTQRFLLTELDVQMPPRANEFAINASNARHWGAAVRGYIEDCISGKDGPRGVDCNMRWVASMVADCHRILVRGGVYLYPRDMRPGYENGRLRLIYEGNPIAFLVEQAGGKAFDGRTRILDLVPTAIHQRVPLMFGSADEVDRIARYVANPDFIVPRAPLFHRRGLFKL